ncbi:MAG: Cafeteria roenbergensis virus [Bacteroidota bacterium]|jgi:hypothetical protein
MKIALCFSGNIRDLDETKNFWLELIEKYKMDVYASFWDIENKELNDTIENFLKIYTPKKYEIENYNVFKQTTQDIASLHIESPTNIHQRFQETSKAFGQLSMYYKVWKCNMLSKQLGIEYDLVIRARTDIVLDENFTIVKNNMLNVPKGSMMVTVFPDSDSINDCFAYGNPKIMDYYSFIFLQMMEYLKEGHYVFPPEHFLAVHFSKVKIMVREFPTYMMITRKSKGTAHDLYNHFMKDLNDDIYESDYKEFIPQQVGNFKKESIKDDFIV